MGLRGRSAGKTTGGATSWPFVSGSARAWIARVLEAGALGGASSGAASSIAARASAVWGAVAASRLVKPLPLDGLCSVAIGGATLGGSGKTPLAIAVTEALARAGVRTALVGHAYEASPRRARLVRPTDDLAAVGDEALLAARTLDGLAEAFVVVAPTRAAAVEHARFLGARAVVLDGVHQTAPRASLALLALDATAPWGSGACPPEGDLRAPRGALRDTCDHVVRLLDDGDCGEDDAREASAPGAAARNTRDADDAELADLDATTRAAPGDLDGMDARVRSDGARTSDGARLRWSELRGLRLGLVTAIARPARVFDFLGRRGVHPRAALHAPDHGAPPPHLLEVARAAPVDLWLTSAKCALHLGGSRLPLAVLDHRLELGPALRARIAAAAGADALSADRTFPPVGA